MPPKLPSGSLWNGTEFFLAVGVRPTVTAARRRWAVTRLEVFRVDDESTLPPLILHPGARASQQVKCLALYQRDRSVAHFAMSRSVRKGPMP